MSLELLGGWMPTMKTIVPLNVDFEGEFPSPYPLLSGFRPSLQGGQELPALAETFSKRLSPLCGRWQIKRRGQGDENADFKCLVNP